VTGLERLLGGVDGCAGTLALFGRQFAQLLQQLGQGTAFTKIAGLDLFQLNEIGSSIECRQTFLENHVNIAHGSHQYA
jgi:hypothetical protein